MKESTASKLPIQKRIKTIPGTFIVCIPDI